MALRPVPMVKVGLLGLRSDETNVLTVLHDLRIAQVEPLSAATLAELGPERGSDTLRRVGDETLRFRALLSALPPVGPFAPKRIDSSEALFAAAATVNVDAKVGELAREDDKLQTEAKTVADSLGLLEKISFYTDRLELLRAKSLLTLFGEGEPEAAAKFRAAIPAEADATFFAGPPGEVSRFLLVARSSSAEAVTSAAQGAGIRLASLPPLEGTVAQAREELLRNQETLAARRTEIRGELEAISAEWYPTIAAVAEALEIENRKAEVLSKLGASRSAFALEAWVPRRDTDRLRAVLTEACGGRVHFYEVPTTEEAPTMMANPPGVRRFEFFVRFYSLPQASEWDPTLVFSIVFPIFFGFMLGDWGYGLVILLISLWMIVGFPGARHLPKFGRNFVKMIMGPKGMQQLAWALLPGCAIAIGLGLFWDEFFGFSLLHTLVGYHAPIAPASRQDLPKLLLLAGYIGLGMVVLGFLFGALKEYFHHHLRGVLAKSGGILFAFGVAFFGLAMIHHAISPSAHPIVFAWFACMGAGFALMLVGEGVQTAGLGLLEVISHILSYTRLVGILLASVILALVINTIGGGLVGGGTIAGIVFGLLILVVGQSFNVILGVFEPGIQGARLIFVEYFSKFYSGNGRPFRPFGTPRSHTVPSVDADGKLGPIVQAPES